MKKKNIIISSKFIGLLIFLFLTSFLTIRSFKEVKLDDLFIEGDEFITKEDLIDNSSLIFPTKLIFIKTTYLEKELKENLSLKNISINRRLIPFQLKIYLQTRIPFAYAESQVVNKKFYGYVLSLDYRSARGTSLKILKCCDVQPLSVSCCITMFVSCSVICSIFLGSDGAVMV